MRRLIGPGSDIKLENNHLCCYNIDRKTFGVFPRISRINHSCVPNCVDSAGSNKEEKIVVALRKISKGEELSLSYLHTSAGSKAMRAEELRYWNFVCHCELCLRETRAESVSRENIVALAGEVTDFVKLLEDAQDQEPYMNDDQKRFLSTTIYCGIDKKLAVCETLVTKVDQVSLPPPQLQLSCHLHAAHLSVKKQCLGLVGQGALRRAEWHLESAWELAKHVPSFREVFISGMARVLLAPVNWSYGI